MEGSTPGAAPSSLRGPILAAQGICKDFRRSNAGRDGVVHALADVSMELKEGETLGVVGESGSGKSTLARILMRLQTPTAGRVLYRGEDVFGMGRVALRTFRQDVQLVFQDPRSSLSPRLSAREIIGEAWVANPALVPKSRRQERVRELMQLVGLNPSHDDRYAHEFSGGQQQRLGIARALAVEPRVLVCDEPVSSLDVSVQAQIVNLLRRLQAELRMSYVFIAHDLAVVRQVADAVIVMQRGRIVEAGRTETVYAEPAHPYTRGLLAAIPQPVPGSRPAPAAALAEESRVETV